MAYPPLVPPATRVNATPQVDLHPSDHNQISAALTEIINKIATMDANRAADNRRVGCGVYTGSQVVPAQTNVGIIYDGEAVDTDNMHQPNSGYVTIPLDGVYSCTLTVTLNAAMTMGYSGLVRIIYPGGAVKQNTIVEGQVAATCNYTGPCAAGGIFSTSFWNGGGANFMAASFEVYRVAL